MCCEKPNRIESNQSRIKSKPRKKTAIPHRSRAHERKSTHKAMKIKITTTKTTIQNNNNNKLTINNKLGMVYFSELSEQNESSNRTMEHTIIAIMKCNSTLFYT